MQKTGFNLFAFLKSCIQFVKVVIVFAILMFLLYWIQDLTGDSWAWFAIMNPFFSFLVDIGYRISDGSIMLFDAVFEYKFLIGILILAVLYIGAHLCFCAIEHLELICADVMRAMRKKEEITMNNSLTKQSIIEQTRIKKYQIYISTQVKSKYAHREYNVNLDEQNQILVKHLFQKTRVCPEMFENGYVFTFDNFNQIDSVLDVFTKLFESTAPIDYIVCVQIFAGNLTKEVEQLKTLINLKFLNRVIMMADTAYRYGFNEIKNYQTSNLGLFQKGTGSFEVHEFIKNE